MSEKIANIEQQQETEVELSPENFRGRTLRAIREWARGLTREELATRIGVSVHTLKGWEESKGRAPSYNNLQLLCEELRCNPVQLYSDFHTNLVQQDIEEMTAELFRNFWINVNNDSVAKQKHALNVFNTLTEFLNIKISIPVTEDDTVKSLFQKMQTMRYDPTDTEDGPDNEEKEVVSSE